MSPVEPDHRQIAEFYDRHYHKDAVQAPPGGYLVRMAERLEVRPGEKVLDIACGTGEWLSAVADKGAEISGIDISERAVAVCRTRLPQGAFEVGVAETLPYPSDHFDLVTCLGSLEHFLDQPGALREMARVSKASARLVILVPNSGFLPYRLGLYKGTQQRVVRETLRSLSEWQSMLGEAGLRVEQRWRDLHVLNPRWIMRSPWWMVPVRALLGLMLPLWPLEWQYQVHFACRLSPHGE